MYAARGQWSAALPGRWFAALPAARHRFARACRGGLPAAARILLGMLSMLGGLGVIMASPAQASSLQVTPTLLEFRASQLAQGLWLRNSGTTEIYAQVRILRWTQAQEQDQLEPTRDLVPSPPIIRIAPDSEQLVRVIDSMPTRAPGEQAYRILIDELPYVPGSAPGAPSGSVPTPRPEGLKFLLRYSVPVFVAAAPGSVPEADSGAPSADSLSDISALDVRVALDHQGTGPRGLLRIVNHGTRRVKISQLTYVDGYGNRYPVIEGLLGYVLAGQSMSWPLKALPDAVRQVAGRWEARINEDVAAQFLGARIELQ